MLTGVHHVAYVVDDMDGAVRFIESALGLKVTRRETLNEFEMTIFNVGTSRIELIRPIDPNSQYVEFIRRTGGGLNHVAFETTDIEADTKRMVDAGVGFEQIFLAETKWCVTNVDSRNVLGFRLQLAKPSTVD